MGETGSGCEVQKIGLSPKGLGGEEQAGIRRERKAREGHGQEGRQGGAKQNESPFIPKPGRVWDDTAWQEITLQKQVETGRSSNFHPSGDAPREAELKSGTRSYAPLLPFRPGLEQRNGEGNGSNGSVEVTAEDHFKVSNGRHSARHNPSLPGEIARQANEWKGGDDPGALGGLPSPLRPAIRVDNAGDGGSPLPSPMRRVTFNKHHISVQFSDEGSEKEGDKIPVFSHSGHSPGSGYGKSASPATPRGAWPNKLGDRRGSGAPSPLYAGTGAKTSTPKEKTPGASTPRGQANPGSSTPRGQAIPGPSTPRGHATDSQLENGSGGGGQRQVSAMKKGGSMSRPPRHFGEASHLEEEDFFRAKQIESWALEEQAKKHVEAARKVAGLRNQQNKYNGELSSERPNLYRLHPLCNVLFDILNRHRLRGTSTSSDRSGC